MPVVRKTDELGRLVLPQDLRSAMEIVENDEFIIEQVSQNAILLTLRKRQPCARCKAIYDFLNVFYDSECRDCIFSFYANVQNDVKCAKDCPKFTAFQNKSENKK